MKISPRGVLGAAFILGMCALCVRLGFWQLDRLQQKRERNAALAAKMRLPPLTLGPAAADSIRRDPGRFANRRARAAGAYLPGGEVVLRGRAHDGRPGVHLVTPLVLSSGGVVYVNRGWVPSPDAATVDPAPYAEPGTREVEGILQEVPVTRDGGAPAASRAGGTTTYRRLDLETLGRRAARPVLPLYLQQFPGADPDRAAPPVRLGAPELSEGPHLGYAIQWFSFAAIGVVGLAILALRGQRRPPK